VGEWTAISKGKTIVSHDNTNIIAHLTTGKKGKAERQANAQLIAHAPELLQMVYDLKECIKRLTQDDVPQYERDKEAQWEGEAHELLVRINPDYYANANEVSL